MVCLPAEFEGIAEPCEDLRRLNAHVEAALRNVLNLHKAAVEAIYRRNGTIEPKAQNELQN
jgi:hypothetical protein